MGDHTVETFLREGQAFQKRHPNMPEVGSWAWGLLRAFAECPNCPGHFRVPLDPQWNRLVCPNCKTVWEHKAD